MWGKLHCRQQELHLPLTLSGGQSFRWQRNEEDEWIGVFANKIWVLKRDNDYILYKTINPTDTSSQSMNNESEAKQVVSRKSSNIIESEHENLLKSYFRLEISLNDLYEQWSLKDENFKLIKDKFYGVRVLKQDAAENLFAFICSSNNHISRISSMVEKLCTIYGPKISTVNGVPYHAFPSVKSLSGPSVEQTLRTAGFGYRAKFIQQSAASIQEMGGEKWLSNLETMTYGEAKVALMKLPGIGAKVADCICLMSLGHLQAVPVDTHVWQISCRYLPHLKEYKSVTTKVYGEIVEYFQNLYGPLAGWAHTVLFCADLKKFQEGSSGLRKNQKLKSNSSMQNSKRKKEN